MVVVIIAIALAFAFSCWITRWLSDPPRSLRILDQPNERSLHTRPTPRTGGLAIWAGAAVGIIALLLTRGLPAEVLWIAGAAVAVGAVSLLDDRSHVPAAIRLAVHSLSGCILLLGGMRVTEVQVPGADIILPAYLGVSATLVFVVWMINLYNFMDGMDGFAGGMAVFGFGTLGALGWIGGNESYAATSWVIAGAAGGFLIWNFPPARVFMGDFGSSALGLMVAAMSLLGDRLKLFPLWIALLVFSPFIVDATVTLVRRASRRERLWEAHRSHYYQRLVQLGWGHKRTVLAEYVLMASCAASAIVLLHTSVRLQWFGIGGWIIGYAVLVAIVSFRTTKLSAQRGSGDRRSGVV